ncbi:hypothetical protein IHE44_0001328 [Lamprotornis superbus]|uniref:Uncharacterized protein n=1 Tax=Lamprotornis superbus TaxID=245042 RepID=A0A835TPB1_9PASS|nr:hypothetical protein IHE44_0001328 [Lamprotornis superbus]
METWLGQSIKAFLPHSGSSSAEVPDGLQSGRRVCPEGTGQSQRDDAEQGAVQEEEAAQASHPRATAQTSQPIAKSTAIAKATKATKSTRDGLSLHTEFSAHGSRGGGSDSSALGEGGHDGSRQGDQHRGRLDNNAGVLALQGTGLVAAVGQWGGSAGSADVGGLNKHPGDLQNYNVNREKCCARFPFTNVLLSPGTVLGEDVRPLGFTKEEETSQALMKKNFIEVKETRDKRIK